MLHVLAAVALAASGAPGATTEANDPVVCKKSKLPDVGTRFKAAPVCKRKSVWASEQRVVQRELQQMNERTINPGRSESR